MSSLFFSISLALLNNSRFVVHTNDDPLIFLNSLVHFIHKNCQLNPICIDGSSLNPSFDESNLLHSVSSNNTLSNIIILHHLDVISESTQKRLVKLLDKLDRFNRNDARLSPQAPVIINGEPFHYQGPHSIIAIINTHNPHKIIKPLREKFWFSHFANNSSLTDIDPIPNYVSVIASLLSAVTKVFQSHDITNYIYSLIVHIRNHRLCSMASISNRLHTNVIDQVSLLCKTLVVWKSYVSNGGDDVDVDVESLFVTPEYCKIAIRRIGYWLVDWEQTKVLGEEVPENNKKMVISMLAGEWFSSDYEVVKKYLEKYRSIEDENSCTGRSNRMVEDAIEAVKPPI